MIEHDHDHAVEMFGECPTCVLAETAPVVRPEIGDRPPPVHSNARAAERRASGRVAPVVGTLRRQVLDLARAAGPAGITSIEATREIVSASAPSLDGDALELAVRRKLYSVAPRLTELVEDGLLAASDDLRDDRMIYRAV